MGDIVIKNEEIEQAIAKYRETGNVEDVRGIVEALRKMAVSEADVLVPVDVVSKGGEDAAGEDMDLQLKKLSMNDKSVYLAAFTCNEELHKGPPTMSIVSKMEHLMVLAEKDEDVSGIVINPWSNFFIVNMSMINIVKELLENGGVQKRAISGDFTLEKPEEVPQSLVAAVETVCAELGIIEKVHISCLTSEGRESYLMMVEFTGGVEKEEAYDAILSAAAMKSDRMLELTHFKGEPPAESVTIFHKQ